MKGIKGGNDFYEEDVMVDTSIIGVIAIALFIFGVIQFTTVASSVFSNPLILQNLTSQGYTGYYIYTAPPFASAWLLIVVGLAIALVISKKMK